MLKFLEKKIGKHLQKKRTLLAFEYGVVICEVARKNKVKITPELIKKAERMIEEEFKTQSLTHLSVNMIPNVLSVFELDLNK